MEIKANIRQPMGEGEDKGEGVEEYSFMGRGIKEFRIFFQKKL